MTARANNASRISKQPSGSGMSSRKNRQKERERGKKNEIGFERKRREKRKRVTLTFAVADVTEYHIHRYYGARVSYRVVASALRYFVT